MTQLTRQALENSSVFVLDLGDGVENDEHRFSPDRLAAIQADLTEVEAAEGPAALVITGTGKFFSNGLEPERFVQPGAAAYLNSYERLLARLLTLETPTVAAIQGHCYAGGLLFALAADTRIMRADRGFLCLPEVFLGIDFAPGMFAVAQARLSPQTAHLAVAAGRRYDGPGALAAGIVDELATEAELLPRAIAIAQELTASRGPTFAAIKKKLYADALAQLGTIPEEN